MSQAKQSLRYKRLARVYERQANEWAASDAPWALRNLRCYQGYMCRTLADRSRIIRAYLDVRVVRCAQKPGATTMEQDTQETPVLFRMERAPVKYGDDVTAVFPCEPADMCGHNMGCYVHVGQHGGCGLDWYRRTRPALPHEYASLKKELEGLGYKLRVYQRMTRELRNRFDAEVDRLNNCYLETRDTVARDR